MTSSNIYTNFKVFFDFAVNSIVVGRMVPLDLSVGSVYFSKRRRWMQYEHAYSILMVKIKYGQQQ